MSSSNHCISCNCHLPPTFYYPGDGYRNFLIDQQKPYGPFCSRCYRDRLKYRTIPPVFNPPTETQVSHITARLYELLHSTIAIELKAWTFSSTNHETFWRLWIEKTHSHYKFPNWPSLQLWVHHKQILFRTFAPKGGPQ